MSTNKTKTWLVSAIIFTIFVSACSGGATPTPADTSREVGTPTPVSNLPDQQQENTKAPERDRLDPEEFANAIGDFVLRPDDLPNAYRVPEGGERRVSNLGIIQQMGEVAGKHYIVNTGRVEGWQIKLERRKKEDIAPGAFESAIELFESSDGAALALSPEWFKAYKDENKTPTWVEAGCDLGDECLFYYYQSIDPATNLTKLEYDVAFSYKNVIVWVMGRGLDIDTKSDYVLKAAEAVYKRLEAAS